MTGLADRQRYALTHPLNDARDQAALLACRAVRKHRTGLLLVSILAVDR